MKNKYQLDRIKKLQSNTGDREIKFRAWDIGKREMTEDFTLWNIHEDGQELEHGNGSMFVNRDHQIISEKDIVFMQSTGLVDKNGVEIYDGDILRVDKYNRVSRKRNIPSVVFFMKSHSEFQHTWDEGSFHSDSGEFWINEPLWRVACLMSESKCEIIGNVFENPEVIDDKKSDEK